MAQKLFLTVIISMFFLGAVAQQKLFVVFHNDNWMIPHRIGQGETIFQLARRYHVPPAILAGTNQLDYQDGLTKDSILYIPLGAYNQQTTQPLNANDSRPLYYKVDGDDNLFRISRYAGVQQKKMQEWNHLNDNSIHEGQELFVGWLLFDATQNPVYNSGLKKEPVSAVVVKQEPQMPRGKMDTIVDKNVTLIPIKDSADADTVSAAEKLYIVQTNHGINASEEKGMAVFFDTKMKGETYYAFHNSATRGTIIKVYNPGTDKTVYVKVIGAIPGTKQYYNSILGISSAAKKELQVREDKMWCELSYNPQ